MDLEILGVISNLENKLHIAIRNNPKKDFTEQKAILSVLRNYRNFCLECAEENRIMDKKYIGLANKYTLVFDNMTELSKENNKLKKMLDYEK